MGQRSIPAPVAAVLICVVVAVVGFFLYRGATGGTVGDGRAGNSSSFCDFVSAHKILL